MTPAVLLLVFNRPDTTARVFEAIRRARPALLYVAADGPRPGREGEAERCEEVRRLVTQVDWPCQVKTLFRNLNLGCKSAVSGAITWFFEREEEGIILEDDCLPSEDFFRFCSELLPYYRAEPRVMHISGDNFQDGIIRGDGSYYFSRYPHIWGWASWRRAWKHYDVSLTSWPEARRCKWLKGLKLDGAERRYWTRSFNRVYAGAIDTWDYQWLYACWRERGVGILPNVNLVTNIGESPNATHTKVASPGIGIPRGNLSRVVHPVGFHTDGRADRYTFDSHWSLFSRIRRRTWGRLLGTR